MFFRPEVENNGTIRRVAAGFFFSCYCDDNDIVKGEGVRQSVPLPLSIYGRGQKQALYIVLCFINVYS